MASTNSLKRVLGRRKPQKATKPTVKNPPQEGDKPTVTPSDKEGDKK